ncbi:long-chain fatty acid--CoA ligase [Salinimicrobium tongyeongense]|uniref:Long-chain fatty acid--CoA ligase n=1 Tax=Salinimicrobium tongyeongense TaxID=2809707 RepID=A0ABY6NNP8_9FLAO|nr:AMP-dependent synthetase/ligase [Salinimicrobium tongyeongense]UZH54516.1 long-chain fatty acid--CoA ligase [Salinimicrobium tongyeongense]
MIEIKRLFDFPYFQLENAPREKSLVTKYNGKWEALSSQEYVDQANAVSRGLLRLGIQPNDKIAVISTSNRTEWNVLDIGILQLGAQNVPIYPTISEEDYEYVLNHSESIYCFVSDKEILDKLNTIRSNTSLKGVYTFDEIAGADNWKEILKLGEDKSNQDEVEARKKAVKEDDLATLIYTSGTTGRPKGVMLSHKNIVSDVLLSSDRVPFEFGTYTSLSFLPVCHIFERMILYLYQYYSVSIHFAESIDKISDNLKEVKPHVISAVPRLLEKVYDKIIAKGSTVGGIKQKLFFWSVELGLEFEPYGANGWWYETRLKIARKLVFSKWKEGLGGRIELIVSGSAALQPRLARVFAAAGIPVMEGYGLTETSPVIAVNDQRNRGFKIGTVGKVLKNVEVKIAEDGEILCKGPNVMMGYYKEPEKTKQAINEDGYFHTGDIGELDSEGFLKITDRKKEMFKTSGGKYVAPQVIENQMKQSRFIAELMVIGEGEKMPAALIQPDFEFVREWAKRKHIEVGPSNADLIHNEEVKKRIQEEVDFYNQKFGSWEKIKKFELTPDVWSIESEHLTPTMKLKRRNIIKLYQDLYDGIYEKS